MEKNIKDYLHFYLGCDVKIEKSNYYLVHNRSVNAGMVITMTPAYLGDFLYTKNAEVKPILRTTQSVTQDEWNNAPKGSLHIGTDGIFYSPELFLYILNLQVDLFGLIEADLAINKATL